MPSPPARLKVGEVMVPCATAPGGGVNGKPSIDGMSS